jgi:hypothetical protein
LFQQPYRFENGDEEEVEEENPSENAIVRRVDMERSNILQTNSQTNRLIQLFLDIHKEFFLCFTLNLKQNQKNAASETQHVSCLNNPLKTVCFPFFGKHNVCWTGFKGANVDGAVTRNGKLLFMENNHTLLYNILWFMDYFQ